LVRRSEFISVAVRVAGVSRLVVSALHQRFHVGAEHDAHRPEVRGCFAFDLAAEFADLLLAFFVARWRWVVHTEELAEGFVDFTLSALNLADEFSHAGVLCLADVAEPAGARGGSLRELAGCALPSYFTVIRLTLGGFAHSRHPITVGRA
jgi:hypothetical protein